MPGHIVLLGDSVFDNAAYVGPGEKDVSAHLRQHFAGDSGSVELAAADGAVITSVERQLASARISDPCLLVLSVGGNDLLGHSYLLEGAERRSFGETMLLLRGIRADFEHAYRGLLDLIARHEQPTVVCTIYNPQFPDRDLRHAGEVVVSVFNDFIAREATKRGMAVIDLRDVCNHASHFANPIEPSEAGGAAIAEAILAARERYSGR